MKTDSLVQNRKKRNFAPLKTSYFHFKKPTTLTQCFFEQDWDKI